MEEFPSNILQDELEQREKENTLLEAAEGFHLLTDRQQSLIKQSLYTQARAERGTDHASQAAIVSPKLGYVTDETRILDEADLEYRHKNGSGPDPSTRGYRLSQNHIANWNCHAAIANLEEEVVLGTKPKALPAGFFKAEYAHVKDFEELQARIEGFGFPVVLHADSQGHNGSRADAILLGHSCLILGHNNQGELICWEKTGYNLTYRLSLLKDMYEEYKDCKSWGLRKLHTK